MKHEEHLVPLALHDHVASVARLLASVTPSALQPLCAALQTARRQKRAVYTFGNGGSAATALHFANDLSHGPSGGESHRLRVSCLNANISLLTAVANDQGYDQVFAEQLRGIVQPGDVLVGFSVSGNSPNCVNAMRLGQDQGAITIGILGSDGGAMRELCQHVVHVPGTDCRSVEDVHLIIGHAAARAVAEAAA